MAHDHRRDRCAPGWCQDDRYQRSRCRRLGSRITEAVEVGYLFGGTAALVMGANAFQSS